MNTLDKQKMESRLDKVIQGFNDLSNHFESEYLKNFREDPLINIVLGKSEIHKLILGAFAIDGHEIDSIKFDGDLKIVLTKIEK